jgi:hypothetical protein
MKKTCLLLLITLFAISLLSAQNSLQKCGITQQDEAQITQKLKKNLQILSKNGAIERGNIQYIPIFFHQTETARLTQKLILN